MADFIQLYGSKGNRVDEGQSTHLLISFGATVGSFLPTWRFIFFRLKFESLYRCNEIPKEW